MESFRGTYTALVTPFRDEKVDLEALERLVDRQLEAGVDGLVPCGTTGEAPTLAMSEHRPVVSLVAKLAKKRAKVIAGSGANSTAEAIELARLNADCGADGLLIVAPYYNRPSQDGLYRHYAKIAQATDLPIVVYNIPSRCSVEIAVDTMRRLFDEFDNIVAVKHATGSVVGASDLMATCDIPILSGDDPITLALMSIGAVGTISTISNLCPRTVQRMVEAALSDDWATARDVHHRMFPLARALMSLETNPMPIKTALALKGLCTDEFRLPLVPLNDEKRAQLETLLEGVALD
jgi:4-hydroxy-tetrahydrodipicolinate synthase